MESRNPVFANSEAFKRGGYATFDDPSPQTLQDMYDAPAATPVRTGRMTIDDVVMKTAAMFGVLILTGAVGWWQPGLAFPGLIAGLVLGLIIAFKQSTSPGLILSYAAAEGLFLGGISRVFESQWEGVVPQAVLGTAGAFAGMLVLYRTGRLRATPKFVKMFTVAAIGYLVVAAASFIAALFGVGDGWGFRTGGLGLLICAVGVALASLSLILDFDYIERGIQQGLPQRFAWFAAFGLVVSLVWLYIELLRLLAILRGEE